MERESTVESEQTWHEAPTGAHNVIVLNGVVLLLHVHGEQRTRQWELLDTGLVLVG